MDDLTEKRPVMDTVVRVSTAPAYAVTYILTLTRSDVSDRGRHTLAGVISE
jgi:hypothetical protein